MRVDLHPEARAELRRAALWYEEQRPGLGGELVAEVSFALDRVAQTPEAHPAWPGVGVGSPLIRRSVLQRFPYLIAFEHHEERLLVLAIAHARRRPLYWLARATRSRP